MAGSEFRMTGDLDSIVQHLDGLSTGIDLGPLAADCEDVLKADNARAAAAGQDFLDEDYPELSRSDGKGKRRPLRPSEYRARGGTGPPLAPRGAESRIVTAFETESIPLDDGAILVVGRWPTLPWLIYHIEGRGHNPVRDPVGVRPEANAALAAKLREFLQGLGFR